MGFNNGNLTSKTVKVEKGERGKTGEGFSLTADRRVSEYLISCPKSSVFTTDFRDDLLITH